MMIKVFLKGIIFGIGFLISITVAGYIYINYSDSELAKRNEKLEAWHSLTEEEKIKTAQRIVIVKFSEGKDNVRLASVSAVYTKDPSDETDLEIGQPYPKANYYPLSDLENRSSSIFLFIDDSSSPASTWHAYDQTIPAVGNMRVELLVEKFHESKQGK